MVQVPLAHPVPHSVGVERPSVPLPAEACDCHMHIFDPRFAPSPHWKRQPPVATVATYRQLQHRLGTSRAVVVTPSTYGTDNSCTLDALEQLGDSALGVAVVAQDVTEAELQLLDSKGIRGLRVNFVTPQSWGTTTPEMLVTLAAKVAPLNWHIQVFMSPEHLVGMQSVLAALPAPLVIDHMGRIDPRAGAQDPAFGVILDLLDGGNTWVKLSGVYMRSSEGAPSYGDAHWLGSTLVDEAPERLVWGSDWPHTTEAAGTVNDANLLDVLRVWCASDDRFAQILVNNPIDLYGFEQRAA